MILGPNNFLDVISIVPIASIDLIIRDDKGMVLLTKGCHCPVSDHWFVPGGRILKNETIDHAISRISALRIGHELKQKQVAFQGIFEHFYPENVGMISLPQEHYIVLAYQGFMDVDTELKKNTLYFETEWWAVEELMVSTKVHSYTKSYFF